MKHAHKQINVVFVIPGLLFGGGIEAHLIKMLRVIDRKRFTCSIITLFDYLERPDLYADVPQGVRVIRLASKGIVRFSTWAKAYRALRELRPDVVISSMFSPNALVRVLKLAFGYRVITREHNTYDEKRWYHRLFDHLLSYDSDAIVAVSSDVADFISRQAWIPRKKITVINNGVDIERIREFVQRNAAGAARVRSELDLSNDEKIILNVARLKETKDHTLLLETFKLFQQSHPRYHLAIAGDGSERAAIERKIDVLGLRGSASLLGRRRDIDAWYAAADMFVLSSKREGFPNVLIEAMAFGLPCVSTVVAGSGDIIEDGKNGFIVERSSDAMARAMDRIAALSPDDRALFRGACIETASRFDIKSVVHDYENLIERICRQ